MSVICTCGAKCRHWVTENPTTKHVRCPACKEHYIWELTASGKLGSKILVSDEHSQSSN